LQDFDKVCRQVPAAAGDELERARDAPGDDVPAQHFGVHAEGRGGGCNRDNHGVVGMPNSALNFSTPSTQNSQAVPSGQKTAISPVVISAPHLSHLGASQSVAS